MKTSVLAVKKLMATLGVKKEELFSPDELKQFLLKTVSNQNLSIDDIFGEEAQECFVEDWLEKHSEQLTTQFPDEEIQGGLVKKWIEEHPEEFAQLFADEEDEVEEQKSEKQPEKPQPPVQKQPVGELKFVRDGSYEYALQDGKVIGVVILNRGRRVIVMHDYDRSNLSKEEAMERARTRPTVNGKHWRLLTDDDCRAMCHSQRDRGGNAVQELVSLMKKLGGNFVSEEHLTEEYSGPQRYRVKYAVDLD